MEIIFLGTGTSHGVPKIGCKCKTCLSKNLKNKRNRCSLYIKTSNLSLLIDTPAEFRISALKYNIKKVDAVLYTHFHSDHIAGLDDLRSFSEIQNSFIPIFANKETINEIKKRFPYIIKAKQIGGGIPNLKFFIIKPYKKFKIKSIYIIPILVKHGIIDVIAYRIKNIVYMTDVSYIPEKSFEFLKNIEVLILDALRFEEHPTHFNLFQAMEIVQKVKPQKTYFTHISHHLEHNFIEKILPNNIKLSYDGLKIII